MATYTETAIVPATVEEVYGYRLDFTHLPEYNPDVTELEHVNDLDSVEAEYTFRVKIAALRPAAHLRVVEAAAPNRIVVEISSMFRATEVCEFEPAGDDATKVTFTTTVHTSFGPLTGLVDRFFVVPSGTRQTRKELDLIKAHFAG